MIIIILVWFKYKMMVYKIICGQILYLYWIYHDSYSDHLLLSFLYSMNSIKLHQLELFWEKCALWDQDTKDKCFNCGNSWNSWLTPSILQIWISSVYCIIRRVFTFILTLALYVLCFINIKKQCSCDQKTQSNQSQINKKPKQTKTKQTTCHPGKICEVG